MRLPWLRNPGEVVRLQESEGLLTNGLQAVLLEGALQPGRLEQLGKGLAAPQAGIAQVVLEGRLGILLNLCPELQGDGLCQAVINVIKRRVINMALPLPAHGLPVEGDLPQLDPGHILTQKLSPDLMPLLRRQVGLCIDPVLEVVYHHAIGDKG